MDLSPQSQALYSTLLHSEHPMDAKQLSTLLKIFPNTVYRLAKPLLDLGLITKTNRYPSLFVAKPVDEGLSLFLLNQNNWFSEQFSNSNKAKSVELAFIQSRDELMKISEVEINKAQISVDLLRSGGELTTEVMLATIEANKRGVTTRMLIQDYSKGNAEQVANWQRNGILVRKTELKQIRLMVYDKKTLYFMSYRHIDSGKDMGMKIDYPPFAAILSQLFEEWWQKAEII
jgi:sugar-specific transcriptional regulator TrmB